MTHFLTTTEQKIENFFQNYPSEVTTSTIHDLAHRIEVSSSSISKYIKKMGYSSFSTFKISLAKQDKNILDEQIDNNDSLGAIQQKMLQTVLNSYENTASLVDISELEKIIFLLDNAKKIYLFGVGASGIVCSDFYFKLSRIGKEIIYHTDSHIQLASLTNATTNDVILGVSYSAKTREVASALKFAHSKKIPTISITGVGNTNLEKYSSFSLKVPRHENTIRSAAITSRNDSLFLIDLLYLGILQRNDQQANQLLYGSYQLTHELRN